MQMFGIHNQLSHRPPYVLNPFCYVHLAPPCQLY
jgi:hypothetical protein